MSMTRSELNAVNRWVFGRKNLYDVIGEVGVNEITVTLENAETGREQEHQELI